MLKKLMSAGDGFERNRKNVEHQGNRLLAFGEMFLPAY